MDVSKVVKEKEHSALPEKQSSKLWLGVLGAGVLLAVIFSLLLIVGGVFFIFLSHPSGGVCQSKQCLIDAANDCGSAEFNTQESYGEVNYLTYDCTFIKNVTKLDAGEPEVVKKMLEGKGLYCTYEKGAFDERWVNSLTLGLDNCKGDLRESIGNLIFSAYLASVPAEQ